MKNLTQALFVALMKETIPAGRAMKKNADSEKAAGTSAPLKEEVCSEVGRFNERPLGN